MLETVTKNVPSETKFGLGRHIYDLNQSTDFSASLEVSIEDQAPIY